MVGLFYEDHNFERLFFAVLFMVLPTVDEIFGIFMIIANNFLGLIFEHLVLMVEWKLFLVFPLQ